jgi:hypothetical protein
MRPDLLGLAEQILVRMALIASHRKARHGRLLASPGLQVVLAMENPLWGTPRVQAELRLLGFDVAEFTVAKYMEYYNGSRPHSSLDCDAPLGRNLEPAYEGKGVAIPLVGGLHHRYTRAA